MHICYAHDQKTGNTPSTAPGLAARDEADLINRLITGLDFPDITIDRVCIGNTVVGVQAGDRMGIASHLHAQPVAEEKDLPERYLGATCGEVAQLLLQPTGLSMALGLAAMNCAIDNSKAEIESKRIQEIVAEYGQEGETALVGNFPFTGWLRDNVRCLHLFELQENSDKLPRNQWETVLPRIKTAAITSTVFLTRYASYFLRHLQQASCIMIGPSTPLTPLLFEENIDILAGSRIIDPERVMSNMRIKKSYSQLAKAGGIEFVAMYKRT